MDIFHSCRKNIDRHCASETKGSLVIKAYRCGMFSYCFKYLHGIILHICTIQVTVLDGGDICDRTA